MPMTQIPMLDGNGQRMQVQCPFHERDLHNDHCYDGMGRNRCKYFVRYEHILSGESPDGRNHSYILCTNKHKDTQLSLF